MDATLVFPRATKISAHETVHERGNNIRAGTVRVHEQETPPDLQVLYTAVKKGLNPRYDTNFEQPRPLHSYHKNELLLSYHHSGRKKKNCLILMFIPQRFLFLRPVIGTVVSTWWFIVVQYEALAACTNFYSKFLA